MKNNSVLGEFNQEYYLKIKKDHEKEVKSHGGNVVLKEEVLKE